MKRKPKQEPFEPTVGLTQVGVLHGELPSADDSIANLREQIENLKIERDEARVAADFADHASDRMLEEIREYEQVLAWVNENVWSCTCCKSQQPQWMVNTYKIYYGNTLYSTLYAAWKARGEK